VALRALIFMAALLCAAIGSGQSSAQTYPARPVRLIVPFGAGGPTDVIARLVAQKLSERWGQQVYTENLPGAGGNTGVATVARAPADGYTILVVSTGFMVNPSMYAKVPYDPIKDFAPITLVAASPNVVSVHPSFPAKTLKELVELVKAHPGKYSFAQPSTGSTPHLAGELFKQTIPARSRYRSIQQRGARDQFHHWRPYPDRIHGAASGHGQHQRRKIAGPRRAQRQACAGITGCADQRGSRHS
jgi:tripartite-type tricarboxylate transporter receptor subunit TctC